jgi:hypothetical protein
VKPFGFIIGQPRGETAFGISAARREYLLDDLAAIVLERALEAGAHFMAVGKVIGNGDDLLVFQLLGGIFGQRVGALRRRRGEANEPRVWVTLRHVLGGSDAQRRHFLFRQIIGDRERLEGRERTDDAVDVVFLDQFLRLGPRGGGNAGRVGNDQFDLAARKCIVAFLQEHRQREFHVDPAGSERAGLGRQQADADRSAALGQCQSRSNHTRNAGAGRGADELSSRYRHFPSSGDVSSTLFVSVSCCSWFLLPLLLVALAS